MAGTYDFPAVDVRLVLRLDSIGEAGLKKNVYSFLEAEGLTHSLPDAIFDRMLSTRSIVVVSSMPL